MKGKIMEKNMDSYCEELYYHIRCVALAHGWVTPEQDNTYQWDVAVVLWLKQYRPGVLAAGGLPDAGSIQTALTECDTIVLYGPKRPPIQQIAWAAIEYEYVRKRYVQEYKNLNGLTRSTLEAIAQDNDISFNGDMLNEDLLDAIVEKTAPLKRITEQCQILGIQIDKHGLIPTQDLPDKTDPSEK
jgi:hypothetical protein